MFDSCFKLAGVSCWQFWCPNLDSSNGKLEKLPNFLRFIQSSVWPQFLQFKVYCILFQSHNLILDTMIFITNSHPSAFRECSTPPPCVPFHMSLVIFHVSHVTWHVSCLVFFSFFFRQSGGDSQWRVCKLRGLTRCSFLSYHCFSFPRQSLLLPLLIIFFHSYNCYRQGNN